MGTKISSFDDKSKLFPIFINVKKKEHQITKLCMVLGRKRGNRSLIQGKRTIFVAF